MTIEIYPKEIPVLLDPELFSLFAHQTSSEFK